MASSGMTRAKYRAMGLLELNVRVPKRLRDAVDTEASDQGLSRQELVIEALEAYLSALRREATSK